MKTYFKIRKPDDFHLHLRDGDILKVTLQESKKHFARALIMPNLTPPIVLPKQAQKYRQEIIQHSKPFGSFTPLMTLYLTENSKPCDIAFSFEEKLCTAVKLYPKGVTTNSNDGVTSIENVMKPLEKMTEIGMPLCIHGESSDPDVDIFDREKIFIEKTLSPLHDRLPELKITLEHISTKQGIDFVKEANANLAGTITPHHLMINRNEIFTNGIQPHFYCLPVAKREVHRQALIKAATSGNTKFFLGTDSAPHLDQNKESTCGCAGIFNASNAIECVAEIFYRENQLKNLENFTSCNGANHYGLSLNRGYLSLTRGNEPNNYEKKIQTSQGKITVFNPNLPVFWQVHGER